MLLVNFLNIQQRFAANLPDELLQFHRTCIRERHVFSKERSCKRWTGPLRGGSGYPRRRKPSAAPTDRSPGTVLNDNGKNVLHDICKETLCKTKLLPKTRTLRVAEADVQRLLNVNFVFLLSRTEQNTRYAWKVQHFRGRPCSASLTCASRP